MSDGNKPQYESPSKKEIENALEKMGPLVSPELRRTIEEAIATLDHTDPTEVLKLLPVSVVEFYYFTLRRGIDLTPLISRAHLAGCYIESIVLSHGLIQLALRGLYVLAWQRAVMPTALSESALKPFYEQRSRRGDVLPLIEALERDGLLFDFHAKHLRVVNDLRNNAAHGVIFGEIAHVNLQAASEKAQHAASGALQRLQAWLNNPQPLREPPR